MDFLISLLMGWFSGAGQRMHDSLDALYSPAANPSAQGWRTAAVCLFLLGATRFLSWSILFCLGERRLFCAVLGWLGLACLQGCILCGGRYAVLNQRTDDTDDVE